MENNTEKINKLINQLEILSQKQKLFSEEIQQLQLEVQFLKLGQSKTGEQQEIIKEKTEISKPITIISEPTIKLQKPVVPKKPSDLEKIIGESWINKIGILILIIGVAIGAKYSIENNLISPLTRIILGYVTGITLLGFGIKLKEKFESYSAVLVSGAMAIFYFITYFAYDFYDLIPQTLAFALMVIFTIFTVLASLKYNRSVIAIIGLVGAYAVPFLLSNNSGNALILFIYITIINLGILSVSIKKYWKPLYYVSFGFTWLIYSIWQLDSYYLNETKTTIIGLVFATIFFLMFYAVAITNRIIQEKKLAKSDIILILLNSFIYFALGYGTLQTESTASYLGLFTLFNALCHFGVGSTIIRNKKIADKTLLYLILGLVFTFITIAIPIQLDGNWVTLAWIALSVLLFWIGRTKNVIAYEKISYVIMFLAFFSLVHDWSIFSYYEVKTKAFFNIAFLTSILVMIGFGYIVYLNRKKKFNTVENQNTITKLMNVALPVLLGIVSYFTFSNEINLYFENWFKVSAVNINKTDTFNSSVHYNYAIIFLKTIFLIGYSIVFFGSLSLFNILKIRNKALGIVVIICTLISLFIAETVGIYTLGQLREIYIERTSNKLFQIGFGYVLVRYLLFGLVAFGIYTLFKYRKQQFMNPLNKYLKLTTEFTLYVSILCFLSNELITWLDLAGNKSVFKLGLSILWGVYALFLIYLGIYKRKKYLRIGAITLFAITLLKLFFYDIANMNTIAKTIVFISLGVLLLLISFLYNKFKDKISEDEKLD